MTTLLRDLRLAVRSLRRNPGFSLVVVLTLAVAIGATVTIATIADHALLRPLPYQDPDRLVTLLLSDGRDGQRLASYPEYHDLVAGAPGTVVSATFVRGTSAIVKGAEGASRLLIGYVSPGHFTTIGARPALGRTFAPDEERSDAGSPVVLSHEYWQRQFGGDPAVVGRTLSLDVGTITVVGVMPPGTSFPAWADVWRPIAAIEGTDPALTARGVRTDSRIVVRLREGVTLETAAAELSAVARRLAGAYPAESKGWERVALAPLRDDVVGDAGPMLVALLAAAMLGLLIACVNVANLSLVRAAGRTRDVAVRVALGAGRGAVVRAQVAEGLVIAAAAGALGVAITLWATGALRAAAPDALPRAAELGVDARVLLLAALLALVVATVCGLAPALYTLGALRHDVATTLRDGRASTGTRGGRRVQSALTVAQFALALVLLVGAGLLVQSFRRVQQVDVGFDPSGVLALRVAPPSPRYDSAPAVAALYARLLDAARAIPGVTGAAFVNHAPLGNAAMPTPVRVPGRATDTAGADGALYKTVSTSYRNVIGMPVQQGRWFTDADMTANATGIVISEEAARRFFPGENPIGRSITVFKRSQARADFGADVTAPVIGVVGSVRHFGMEQGPTPDVYVPYTSEPWPHGVLLVRTSLPPERVMPALAGAVSTVDPEIPVTGAGRLEGVQPLSRNIGTLLATRRWMMSLVTAFAASALFLAALGVYGVTSFAVRQRTHEIGVRVALGATERRVVRMLVGRGLALAGAGVAIGVGGALALTRLLDGMLFSTSPRDPVVFVLVPVILALVAAVASWLPARRAAGIDPATALRAD